MHTYLSVKSITIYYLSRWSNHACLFITGKCRPSALVSNHRQIDVANQGKDKDVLMLRETYKITMINPKLMQVQCVTLLTMLWPC